MNIKRTVFCLFKSYIRYDDDKNLFIAIKTSLVEHRN